ncbi:hypothetical protein [Spongiactinospora sp. TRM90649]|uniref:hypothetical protein n=1 Tax=Spongiactinospora sp. TRM90649 TaxID=3031114 RepID=UPI0023F6654B|nr:hypothetical protein [Spongiactinospora sp. TRM90649]MDF5755806.1 hypothetical protein [Spongiactinospora sp. TRM90649]
MPLSRPRTAAALAALDSDTPLGGPPPVHIRDVIAAAITCAECVEGLPHDPDDHKETT